MAEEVDKAMAEEEAKHKVVMNLPGVVPFSADPIPSITDNEGNMLYTLVCVKE